MMLGWIATQRKELITIYNQCKGKQPVLEAFSVYLLRILNGLSQMSSSQFYDYELQILEEAMRLFFIYYIEQVNKALSDKVRAKEKKDIIEDIEYAISKISNVYKNVIDGTANSDRQMLTSQAVETNIYDLSPKLFITYSAILTTLVRLFHKQDKYAFLLHPSLKSNIETENLFNMREKEGKVVLIYIPETEIEKIHQTPIYLLHEVYHVLTKEERCRVDRARRMETHVLNAISQRLFRNVNFDCIVTEKLFGDTKVDDIIKKELVERWFPIDRRIEKYETITDERFFYRKNISQNICDGWNDMLSNIFVSLGEDILVAISGKTFKYREERVLFTCIKEIEWAIHNNLVEIISGNLVAEYVSLYMSVYREAYADVACILTIGISPEEYKGVFKNSELTISKDISDPETVRALRIHVVAHAVSRCTGISYKEEWEKYSKENDFRKRREKGEKGKEDADLIRKQNDRISILEDDLKWLERIMKMCSGKLWEILGDKDSKFNRFRDIVKNLDIFEILNGKTIDDLQNL
ncbi:hypothetical protein D5281_06080 [bacterium 1xD42-62]|uniref:Uncharacterized protein n=2 Tax=Parablautia muri TaxID=2320879 RepID=A0A9X5GRB8_9FIRM|nr:hypothetical protein [Parablautia muri]